MKKYEDKMRELFGDMDYSSFMSFSTEEALLVIENRGKSFEKIRYRGNDDIEAFKKYKAISHADKCIIKAKVGLGDMGLELPLIMEYEEIEKIK